MTKPGQNCCIADTRSRFRLPTTFCEEPPNHIWIQVLRKQFRLTGGNSVVFIHQAKEIFTEYFAESDFFNDQRPEQHFLEPAEIFTIDQTGSVTGGPIFRPCEKILSPDRTPIKYLSSFHKRLPTQKSPIAKVCLCNIVLHDKWNRLTIGSVL